MISSSKHLFLLVANQSGSHSLAIILNTSRHIVTFSKDKVPYYEGQHLARMPVASLTFTDKEHKFKDSQSYDWDDIKEKWAHYWKTFQAIKKSPFVFLEKSAGHLIHPQLFIEHFPNSYFLIMVRNPYAMAEGICRDRNGCTDLTKCAKHCGKVLRYQMDNALNLDNAVCFKYEEFTSDFKSVKYRMVRLLPELDDITANDPIISDCIDGVNLNIQLENFNDKQVSRLIKENREEITSVLTEYKEEMGFFGYDYL